MKRRTIVGIIAGLLILSVGTVSATTIVTDTGSDSIIKSINEPIVWKSYSPYESNTILKVEGALPGPIVDIEVIDDFAYVCAGTSFLILDISDPKNPTKVGQYDGIIGYAFDVKVVDDIAYITDINNGLALVEISNPKNPKELARYNVSGVAKVDDNIAYTVGTNGLITTFDVSDPKNPKELAKYNLSGVVEVVDNIAYIADKTHGLVMFDVSDEKNPKELARCNVSVGNSIEVVGNIVYLVIGSKLTTLDVSDPQQPKLLGTNDLYYTNPEKPGIEPGTRFKFSLGATYNFKVIDNTAYIPIWNGGVAIFDVSNPNYPRPISSFLTSECGYTTAIYAADDVVYLADTCDGLVMVSVSNPKEPKLLGIYNESILAMAAYVVGDIAYIISGTDRSDYNFNLVAVDVSNPKQLTQLGSCKIFAERVGEVDMSVKVANNIAYMMVTHGFITIDISNPKQPTQLGRYYNYSMRPHDIEIIDNVAYIADTSSGLVMFDVANPEQPTQLGICKYESIRPFYRYPSDVEIINNVAYIADIYNGLVIIDVSNPEQPTQIGRYNKSIAPIGVTIVDNIAYIYIKNMTTYMNNDLVILDISNPKQPVLIGKFAPLLKFNVFDINVFNDIAYISDLNSGLVIFNVSNPKQPSLTGIYKSLFRKVVTVNDRTVYSLTGGGNFAILKWQERSVLTTPQPTPEGVPGFEVIFTIAGLLAIAYLLKKKKEAL